MLSIIAAESIALEPNQEPFAITLSYSGTLHDYWILRGEHPNSYGTLNDSEFIMLRGMLDEGTLPENWEGISELLESQRAATDAAEVCDGMTKKATKQ